MNNITVTTNDHKRLTALLEFASIKTIMPEIEKLLYNKLIVARALPQESISKHVITMNSRVLLKELSSEREIELTITYPQDANNHERKVSILSPIGIALLGRQVGDQVSWKIPRGTGQFEIVDVRYQPEAVGDYHL
ncbi:MAG: prokaryotic transcription elongation factor, GreA/GreB domain protein [Bacteroidota bacterium]|nr:MAG: prokaryotic transcription elongation factor, GreA/GreB domain protein [Bacteroidota bacterium]